MLVSWRLIDVLIPKDVCISLLGGLGARLDLFFPNVPDDTFRAFAYIAIFGIYIPPNTLAAWLRPVIFYTDYFFRNLLLMLCCLDDDFYLVLLNDK